MLRERDVLMVDGYANTNRHLAQILVCCPLDRTKEVHQYTLSRKKGSVTPIVNPQYTESRTHPPSLDPGSLHC